MRAQNRLNLKRRHLSESQRSMVANTSPNGEETQKKSNEINGQIDWGSPNGEDEPSPSRQRESQFADAPGKPERRAAEIKLRGGCVCGHDLCESGPKSHTK
jgi:hypothetical protein